MFNSGNDQRDALTIKITKYIEIVLIVFGLIYAFIFANLFVEDFIIKPTDSVLMGEKMENYYAPRFETYADFIFDEETEKFTLELTDFETIETLMTLDQYDDDWNVVVENMVLLSLEIKEETGYAYDFEIIDPKNTKEIILSIKDGEVLYNNLSY